MSRLSLRAPTRARVVVAFAAIALGSGVGSGPRTTVAAEVGPQAAAAQEWAVGRTSPDGVWEVRADRTLAISATVPATGVYRSVRLNGEALAGVLERARENRRAMAGPITMSLPTSSGRFEVFSVEESPVMEAPLEAAHPEIMTFSAQGLDDPAASGRFDLTPLGFHALIITGTGDLQVIEKVAGDGSDDYIVYSERDQPQPGTFDCSAPHSREQAAGRSGLVAATQSISVSSLSSGGTLRTYRAAIAATGEFTQTHGGGTVNGALSAITSGINAANAILEQEAAIRLVLIANETAIIYTNGATDPYTHLDRATMADENHINLPAVIGPANYDIGHVFDGDAGLAAAGFAYFNVCDNPFGKEKAATIFYGVTPSHPVGLRTVVHEFGHQFNAFHSFNGTTGSCGFGRDALGAYEPGSGSSIMSYADLCGAENVPAISLFHTGSLEQIINYTTDPFGGDACAAQSATGNNPPTVNAGPDYTIPASTPLMLTATGSDPDLDAVTYSWEQFDLGDAAPPNTDNGNRPLFRIYDPSSSPSRMFPELSYILNNTTAVGQALPTTNRTLTFRITGRDNRAGGGGVATDDTVLTVNAASGPFVVTAPNTAVTWLGGSSETVTWDPAGTTGAPIGTANVRITLSTDNGQTFPTVLAASTPNDGSEGITVPSIATSNARVKVEAVGNIFFDISNAAFTISPAGGQPNLKIKSVATVPGGGYVMANAPASIKETTQNTGTGASSASDTKFYLSDNKTLSGDDTLLDPVAGRPVPVLAAGALSTATTSVTIPAVGVGTWYLIAVADANNTNAESNEGDNNKAGTLYVGPDLLVNKITLSSTTVPAGGSVTVTLKTQNKGKEPAGASVSRLYYSDDSKLNLGTDTLLEEINIAPLNAGQLSTDMRTVNVPAGAPSGQRYIIARVDATSQVTEANEKNDKSAKFTVP